MAKIKVPGIFVWIVADKLLKAHNKKKIVEEKIDNFNGIIIINATGESSLILDFHPH